MTTSKILLQLIKEAFLPALIIIAAKLSGVVLSLYYFQIEWQPQTKYLIPQLTLYSTQDFIRVSSWSNFGVILSLWLGLGWILVKAHLLHETHITPKLTLSLINLRLKSLISNTFDLSHQALVWLAYLWLLLLFFAVEVYFGIFYWQLYLISLGGGIILSWFFIVDLEREIKLQ